MFAVLLGSAFPSLGQEKCGTVEYEKIRRQHNPNLENSEQFEKWMLTKVSQIKLKNFSTNRLQTTTYTIPVVVHIINNGEPLGSGINIPDSRIFSQIDIINKDFPRLNADTTLTPAEFKPAAGSINLHFVLAKQDPEGLPTNGIVRVKGSKTGWLLSDNTQLKAQSYWPAENYLNLWVVNFIDPSGIIGYAQLPISSLAGLENPSYDSLTDGVVIDYKAFGLIDPSFYPGYGAFAYGRTATHEIGHIFGLRHIWGDDNGACTGSDYCDDTPNQADSYNGKCPSTQQISCTTSNMFENYMDYTDDACMNLFSKDQVARMVVVLGNSPRRTSLLTSLGATDPTQVANDLGIKRIASPAPASCASVTPSIIIRNYGSNNISSGQIQLTVNGVPVDTVTVTFPTAISYLDSSTVVFSSVTLAAASTNAFSFHILQTNGGADGKASNNSKSQTITVPVLGSLPLFETFDSTPANWSIINPDRSTTWANISAPNGTVGNRAMYMDYYNYESQGEIDELISPSFDFSADTVAVLKFDWSYAVLSSGYNDRLRVLVSTGCNYSNAVEIFNKSGASLATAPNTSSAFTPNSASQWNTATIPLTQFLKQSNVRISFVGTNDFGNNLYLDNVRIITGSYSDLALIGIRTPSPVTCVSNPAPVITVRNDGTTVITSFSAQTTIGAGSTSTQTISGLHLNSGDQQDFTLNPWSLQDGSNDVTVTIQIPNDALPADNTLNLKEVLNTAQDVIPIRENFDSNYPDWTNITEDQMKWVATSINNNTSLEYNAFANLNIASKAWLVSPVLDFSKARKASLFFDLSYAKSSNGIERLQVLSSYDCGQTFTYIPYDSTGDQFYTASSSSSWTPQLNTDWKRTFANLDSLVGKKQVRIAFVVTNGHGNNLFLDNIEIFTDDNRYPATISSEHLVYYNSDRSDPRITFNLQEKETIRLQIYNTLGQLITDDELPDILNQTYHFDLAGNPGIYVVKIQIGNQFSTTKIFIPN